MRSLLGIVPLIPGLLVATMAHSVEGLVTVKSNHSVDATADKLEVALAGKGMTVFNRIDHAGGAADAGLDLPATQLVIFGNPGVGTPLMQCGRTVAIDLPQKALIWEDDKGEVWLGYNDPAYLEGRHNLTGCEDVIEKIKAALGNFARAATD